MSGIVMAVSRSPAHSFSKPVVEELQLVAGLGIEGDVHMGATARVRSRWAKERFKPNLCQVHLIGEELFDELRPAGFAVAPGDIGENITTRGLDLLGLPTGTRLHIGATAIVEVTGLRNPCVQLDRFQSGLMAALRGRDEQGRVLRKAGIMGIVAAAGTVRRGDPISPEWPPQPHQALKPV